MTRAEELGLPDYMGFGRLDIQSIRTLNQKVIARYTAGTEVVYRVALGAGCTLREYFKGRLISQTDHKQLDKCFMHHNLVTNPYQHPRFEELYHRITRRRNVQVRYAWPDRTAYYPAGSGFLLHQPIVRKNFSIWDDIRQRIEDEFDVPPFQHFRHNWGYILRATEKGDVDIEEIELQTYSSLIIDLAKACDYLWGSGLVPPEKEYRLEVAEVPLTLKTNFRIQETAPGSKFRTYAVMASEDEDDEDIDIEIVAELFSQMSLQFIEGLETIAC